MNREIRDLTLDEIELVTGGVIVDAVLGWDVGKLLDAIGSPQPCTNGFFTFSPCPVHM
jgi:hypothetical protein